MKIKLNPDPEIVNTIREGLKRTGGYKPRTWCAFCPMGTMTQGICKLKDKE